MLLDMALIKMAHYCTKTSGIKSVETVALSFLFQNINCNQRFCSLLCRDEWFRQKAFYVQEDKAVIQKKTEASLMFCNFTPNMRNGQRSKDRNGLMT